jgi:hypothetical protein
VPQGLGEGENHLFPRLAGSALVQSDDPTTLAHVVLQGTRAVETSTRPTAPAMPAFDWRLNDAVRSLHRLYLDRALAPGA